MIKKLEYKGKLIHECSIKGETREDGYYPGHINGAQLSRDRFVLFFTSRGWRGSDDNTSVIYQIRDGAYDGPLVHEGRLAKSFDGWDPLKDGNLYVKAHVHPQVFGVPKGARVNGRIPEHAGLFTFTWHTYARYVDRETGFMPGCKNLDRAYDATTITEWTQLRLNEAEDDFEVAQPVETLVRRDTGSDKIQFEDKTRFMTSTFTPPVRLLADGTKWIGSATFPITCRDGENHRIAALEFTYNPEEKLYGWTNTGPLSAPGKWESSFMPYGDSWVVSARHWDSYLQDDGGPVAWMRTDDPFREISEPELPSEPSSRSPSTAFTCADGRIRLITNDPKISPYGQRRNPLYIWDIDPENGFEPTARHVVFDSVKLGMPIRESAVPVVDQGKMLPHSGGSRQIVAHRLRTFATDQPDLAGVPVNDEEKEITGVYYSEIEYDREYPALWAFE